MKREIKSFVGGFLACAFIMGSSVAFASGGSQIEVYFKSLKYVFDGVEKKPTEGQGFIYEGTTYVPLRFVGEALGKDVKWDGENETISVGKVEGRTTYLSDIEYATSDKSGLYNSIVFDKWDDSKFKITGTEYLHGIGVEVEPFMDTKQLLTVDYNLNGKYLTLDGFAGIDDSKKDIKIPVTFKIVGDGKELYSTEMNGGDLPKPVNVNVKNVLKLQLQYKYHDDNYRMINQRAIFAEAKVTE